MTQKQDQRSKSQYVKLNQYQSVQQLNYENSRNLSFYKENNKEQKKQDTFYQLSKDLIDLDKNNSFYKFKKLQNVKNHSQLLNQNKQFFDEYNQKQKKEHHQKIGYIRQKIYDYKIQTIPIKVIPQVKKEQEKVESMGEIDYKYNQVKDDQFLIMVLKNLNSIWTPPNRDSAKMFQEGDKLYLYGGIGNMLLDDIQVFCLKNLKCLIFIKKGSQIEQNKKSYYETKRYGHSMVIFKNKMYIFGGSISFQQKRFFRNDLLEYDFGKNEWNLMLTDNVKNQSRINHGSCLFGYYKVIHGGLNMHFKHQGDIIFFNLMKKEQIWVKLDYNNEIQLQYHTLTPIFYPDVLQYFYSDFENQFITQSNMQKIDEVKLQKIKQQGIYFFGGQNQNYEPTNNLFILLVDERPIRFEKPETQGQPPSARYAHSTTFVNNINLMVVTGGKDANNIYLNDIYALKLSNLNWIKAINNGIPFKQRAYHHQFSYKNQFFVFGGLDQHGHISYNFDVIQIGFLQFILDQRILIEKSYRGSQFVQRQTVQLQIDNIQRLNNNRFSMLQQKILQKFNIQ